MPSLGDQQVTSAHGLARLRPELTTERRELDNAVHDEFSHVASVL
jgi:hypothetical protein